jgi:hypothetical protein
MTSDLINELIDFCTKPHTAAELGSLGLASFPTSNPGVFMRMRRLGVAPRPRKHGYGFVFYFFDFPVEFQREIILFFMRRWTAKGINQTTDEIIVDVLLFVFASRDLQFAESWRRREIQRAKIHEKILRLLEL